MTLPEAHLAVTDVFRAYGEAPVLRGVSFAVAEGEAVAVLGPSGCGKSTLLNIIGSLDRPDSGSVRLGTVDVTALAGLELARFRATQVGFVFQEHRLLPQLTALENVLLPTVPAGSPSDALDRARALLARVGVGHRMQAFPAQLSGGERQRVALARALVNRPRLLLCDEPTGNLDTESSEVVMSALRDVQAATNTTVIVVTHDMEVASQVDRLIALIDGHVAEDVDARSTAQMAAVKLLKDKRATGELKPLRATEP